jgi:hypothetical protein
MNKKTYKMMVMFVVGFGIFLITVGTAGACEPCSQAELDAERCVEFDFNDDNHFDWVLRLENIETTEHVSEYKYNYLLERKNGPCLDVLTKIIQLGNLTNVYNPLPDVVAGTPDFPSYIPKDFGYRLQWDLFGPPQETLSSDNDVPAALVRSDFQSQLQSCSPLQEQKSNSGLHPV